MFAPSAIADCDQCDFDYDVAIHEYPDSYDFRSECDGIEESKGPCDNPTRIGFEEGWNAVLAQQCLYLKGHRPSPQVDGTQRRDSGTADSLVTLRRLRSRESNGDGRLAGVSSGRAWLGTTARGDRAAPPADLPRLPAIAPPPRPVFPAAPRRAHAVELDPGG